MPFAPKTHASLFPASRRRPSYAPDEQSEVLASDSPSYSNFPGMTPSASTSWINPFSRASFSVSRASFSVDDDTYAPPSSPPTSRRPSAATIISTLLHKNSNASSSTVRLDDGGPDEAFGSTTGRRPSAIFKAWKARRGSSSAQPQPPPAPSPAGFAQGRRKSSALTRVLQPSNLRNGAARVDEHSLSSGDTASGRRRSLSIVCRGERDSIELEVREGVREGEVTAAMAIRDTWLGEERKGSVSTLATSPSFSVAPRKSLGGAMGLDMEDQHMQHASLQERLRQIREKPHSHTPEEADDAASVVSLSLTEEIALYTTDVQAVEAAGRARRSVGHAEMPASPFVWNLPDWGSGRLERLPELSPAPQLVIADPFARSRRGTAMQRGESGALDPVLSPVPAYSPTAISSEDASLGHGEGVLWSTAEPFGAMRHRPSVAQTNSWYSARDHSPTSPGFPPTSPLPPSPIEPTPVEESPRCRTAEMRAALRPTSTARSPASPRSFGTSETSYEMRAASRLSYSHPRPPADYESDSQYSATPRLVGDWGGSPMSSLFECETPHQAMFDVTEAKDEEGEGDLHEQFCSVLLLDLGDGRTVGLGGERGLVAC